MWAAFSHDLDQLEDAVTTAHETSDAFSNETLKEQAIFQRAKETEMKEMLGSLADGNIEMHKNVGSCPSVHIISLTCSLHQAIEEWERIIPILQRIRVDI